MSRNFEPTLEELRESGLIFYEVVAGSVAYGLNTEKSDEDLRGYFYVPQKYRNGLGKVANQVNDAKHDITYYNLKRAFELLMTANPNQIELLWIPDDCVRIYDKSVMDGLIANRDLFISKASYVSHFQYAKAQIGKAKGQNKWVNNPKPKEGPVREDFCWYIDIEHNNVMERHIKIESSPMLYPHYPGRPVPIDQYNIDLSRYHVSKMEHMENTYRLYFYGDDAKGVFRNGNIVCESIPKEDERPRFSGLLIYNEQAWKKAFKDWTEYWKWMENRNEHRWVDQEKGNLDYDAKNMSHCLRLMLSSKNILAEGVPIVRFEGDTRDRLMAAKNGELEYDDIMEQVNGLQTELEVLVEKTHIPDEVDFGKLNRLYKDLTSGAETLFYR